MTIFFNLFLSLFFLLQTPRIWGCPSHDLIQNSANEISILQQAPLPKGVEEIFPEEMKLKGLKLQKKYIGEVQVEKAKELYKTTYSYGVEYFSEEEKMQHQVRFGSDGRIYNYKGQLIDTEHALLIKANGRKIKTGQAIFVIDADGKMYLSLVNATGQIHHSSFTSGGDVFFAGEIVVTKGKIEVFDNSSGHYLTPSKRNKELQQYFKKIWGATSETIPFQKSMFN